MQEDPWKEVHHQASAGTETALFTEVPSGEGFSKIKRLVHEAESRSRKALVEAIGAALWAVTTSDARGFFEHCEYRQAVQFLWTPLARELPSSRSKDGLKIV